MNIKQIFKKASLGLTGLAVARDGHRHSRRHPYTGPTTPNSPVPAFNVYTGAPAPDSNEADFLRARVPNAPTGDATTPYVDPLNASCVDGQRLQMRVYVHNGASVAGNNGGSGPSVAHGVRVRVAIPGTESTRFVPTATISATNAATVNDNVTINCGNGKTVKLDYIEGSASSFSKGTGVVPLSDSIVTTGTPIRSQSVPGDVWGCWDDRVYVILSVKVEEVPVSLGICKAIQDFVVKDEERYVSLKVVGEVTNAQIVGYKVDFGDGTVVNQQNADHTYARDGSYTIKGYVQVRFADGHTEWKTANECQKVVNFNVPPPPPVPPEEPPTTPEVPPTPTPKLLPDTGAGSLLGLFASTSVAGGIAHKYVWGRRSRRS